MRQHQHLRPRPPFLGIPGGWVQQCDACGDFEDDSAALNAHLARHGLPPMAGYPFSLVERDDVSPDDPLEQTFFVRRLDRVASVTLHIESDDLGLYELAEALLAGTVRRLREEGYNFDKWPEHEEISIDGCEPAKRVVGAH